MRPSFIPSDMIIILYMAKKKWVASLTDKVIPDIDIVLNTLSDNAISALIPRYIHSYTYIFTVYIALISYMLSTDAYT